MRLWGRREGGRGPFAPRLGGGGAPPALPPRTVPSARAWAVGPAPVRRPGPPSHAAGSGEEVAAAVAASRPLPGRLAAGDEITRPPRAAESGTRSLGKSPGECCSPRHRGLRGEGGGGDASCRAQPRCRRGRGRVPQGGKKTPKNQPNSGFRLWFLLAHLWILAACGRRCPYRVVVAHPSSLAPSPSLVCVLGVFNGDQLKRDFF